MIRIVYSAQALGGLDLSGTPPELRQVRDRILVFLTSDAESLTLASDANADPHPYERTLSGLVVRKAGGLTRVGVTIDGLMEVRGSCPCLESFAANCNFDDTTPAGYRTHFEHWDGHELIDANSIPLVIRVGRSWKGRFKEMANKNGSFLRVALGNEQAATDEAKRLGRYRP